jgi:predicted small metal-binding protein
MAFELACGDIMEGCEARFQGDTEEEVLDQAGRHAADAHGMTEVTPEVTTALRAAMRPA